MNASENVEKLALQEVDDGRELNRRYELVAWGALFILFGAIDLVGVPAGTEWLGIAIILLGLNLMRYISKIPTNIISITLGMIALVLGASRLLHLRDTLPFFETLLIVIGIVLLVRSVTKRSSAGCCFCNWV